MALTEYRKKRSFKDTPEPRAGKPAKEELRFVVQQHKASRLHYDFRLEVGGALKSWAVPKGPSLNPEDKRLAVEVEDHPYAYKDFEGIIPKGNYGAGTVIVWDEGTYEPLEPAASKKSMEMDLMKQWQEGSLKFRLRGKKLKGEFALVKMKGKEDNAWLLIKHKDRYATTEDVLLQGKSVVSGKTLAQLAKTADKHTNGPVKVSKQVNPVKVQSKKGVTPEKLEQQIASEERAHPKHSINVAVILKQAPKTPFPKTLKPMMATLIDAPFDDPDWVYEVKWDGYRALAFINGKSVSLKSRNDKSFADQFYPVFDALKAWDIKAVVDGEIVAVTDEGIANFSKLQNWRSEADGELLYYVFDLLWYEGKDMKSLPLSTRKAMLQTLIPKDGIIRSGYSINAKGTEFFDAASKLGLEGIIAKRSDSHYYPGERSKDWLKIKSQKRQEVVIGGYTRNEGTPKPFSSLLLGVYQGKNFKYVGKVGTGFKDKEQEDMVNAFKPLIRKTSPFAEEPNYNKPSHFRPDSPHTKVIWLRPKLVCVLHYSEITEDGVFRHPAFIAMRTDKDARSVVAEKALPVETVLGHQEDKGSKGKTIKAPASYGRRTLVHPSESTQLRELNGNELKFTNLKKVLWPDEGYTKGDMLNYYWEVAKYMLPYLKERPQSLNRFPNGINKGSFYQKDVTGKVPPWVEKYPYKAEGERKRKHYMLCNNEAALLYMANLAAIEVNPWSSTVHKPGNPTWCLLDLDPDKSNTFEEVIEVARAIHDLLDDMKVPSYCKTSGATGLHIYIPLGAKYAYDQSQLFARWVATEVDSMFDFTSVVRMTSKRKGKVYIDFLQNRPTATLVAPYSLRPKPGATVSMPLYWEEVKKGLKMTDFTIANAVDRLKQEGDIFKRVLGKGIDLKKVLGATDK